MLARAARYLIGKVSFVWRWNQCLKQILVRCKCGWAGCLLARKSTLGVSCHVGGHVWSAVCSTQVPVSLSSAESETRALTRAVNRATGMWSLSDVSGSLCAGELALVAVSELSSAFVFTQRRGSGDVRHLEAGCLWVLDVGSSGGVSGIVKVLARVNKEDLMTKGVVYVQISSDFWSIWSWSLRSSVQRGFHKLLWWGWQEGCGRYEALAWLRTYWVTVDRHAPLPGDGCNSQHWANDSCCQQLMLAVGVGSCWELSQYLENDGCCWQWLLAVVLSIGRTTVVVNSWLALPAVGGSWR